MSHPRQDWSRVTERIKAQMRKKHLTQKAIADLAGVDTKTIRNLMNPDDQQGKSERTRWAVGAAIGWTEDSIDRVLAGEEPIQVSDDTPENVRRLPNPIDDLRRDVESIDDRLTRLERRAVEGTEAVLENSDRMNQIEDLLRQFVARVDRLDRGSGDATAEP